MSDLIESLSARILAFDLKEGANPTAIPCIYLIKRTLCTTHRTFYHPLVGITLGGYKRTILSGKEYCYGAGSCLVTGVDLPSTSYVLKASLKDPFISFAVHLDINILTDLANDLDSYSLGNGGLQNACVLTATDSLLDVCSKLLSLLESKDALDLKVLAPLYLRELHYHLLRAPGGQWLAQLCMKNNPAIKVAKSVRFLREHFKEPIVMDKLASDIGMSVTSFYRYFKKITGLSPLQFQKTLRLYEGQRLMMVQNLDVSETAYNIGYQSVPQFIRDYKQMFKVSPARDVALRLAMT